MGVPKFYRWISERYPRINQIIPENGIIPETDHLYIDMNGIIHGCTHPHELEISQVLSEKEMMFGIMNYLDRIITQIVKPKVSVFMALDGVSPRAKLNQQRSRRFRSAKDMAAATKDNNPFLIDENGDYKCRRFFDPNCITPGTEFMVKVSNTIKYFIRKKIKEDFLWRNLNIYFSGHEVPGEGEHKIMQYIRYMRSQPGYQPNNRHCLYGQDADLIMLGLVSHEPHFTLLREVIDFNHGFNRNDNVLKTVRKFTKQSNFQLLHMNLLREYLEREFAYGLSPDEYDLESIIDDFVFLTFFIGNDFLPHTPLLEIADGSFDLVIRAYIKQRSTWGVREYLTCSGEIVDASRLECLLSVIGSSEQKLILKRAKKSNRVSKKNTFQCNELFKNENHSNNKGPKVVDLNFEDDNFVENQGRSNSMNQLHFKVRYYKEKLNITELDIDLHSTLKKSYVEGLIWCLAYYYKGCISWSWFYPYHYGPILSDITDLPSLFDSIKFSADSPLTSLEQLMCCLPPASAELVPHSYRDLMLSEESPIIHFYPKSFVIDMNGKKNSWEGVCILPFIDVTLLRQVIKQTCRDSNLSSDEKERNSLGNTYCFRYDVTVNDTIQSLGKNFGLPDIIFCHSSMNVFDYKDENNYAAERGLIPGTQIPYPGFPSLNVLPIQSVKLLSIGLNCFGRASKYQSTILTLCPLPEIPCASKCADMLIGKSLFINWPIMHEAKVTAVTDKHSLVYLDKEKNNIYSYNEIETMKWETESSMMRERYLIGVGVPGSGGIDIGNIKIRLKVLPLRGMTVSSVNGLATKQFVLQEIDVPLQMALWNSPAPDSRFEVRKPLSLKGRFPPKCIVIITRGKYRGCLGTVLRVNEPDKVLVRANYIPLDQPFGRSIARNSHESYMSALTAAKSLKLPSSIFGKVTGSLLFNPGRYDIGLNLKSQKDFCVHGYSRKVVDKEKSLLDAKRNFLAQQNSVVIIDSEIGQFNYDMNISKDEKSAWEYTERTLRLVKAYRKEFPILFHAICRTPNEHIYDAKIIGPDGPNMLQKIREWLNNIETAKIPRSPSTSKTLTRSAVLSIQRASDNIIAARYKDPKVRMINLNISSVALYREGSTTAIDLQEISDIPANNIPELGDRVSNLCVSGVPFGARGTVVGIHNPSTCCVDVVMDLEFITGSTLQGLCSKFRGKLCVWNHLLKLYVTDTKYNVNDMTQRNLGEEIVKFSELEVDKSVNIFKHTDTSISPTGKVIFNSHLPKSSNKQRWNKAKGPSDSGIGFSKVGRNWLTGYQAWCKVVLSKNIFTGLIQPGNSKNDYSQARFGMISNREIVEYEGDDVLNVNATANLKHILGVPNSVSKNIPKYIQEPLIKIQKCTALDTLSELMLQNQTSIPHIRSNSKSIFNFSYEQKS